MNSSYIVKWKNIVLRPIENSDLEILRKNRNNKEISRFLNPIGEISKEQQLSWFENVCEKKDEVIFAICSSDDKCVGSCSVYNIKDNEAEFGKLAIGIEHKGNHYGLNAMMAALYLGYVEYKLNCFKLRVFDDNAKAKIIDYKAGFVEKDRYVTDSGKIELLLELHKDEFFNNNDMIGKIVISKYE